MAKNYDSIDTHLSIQNWAEEDRPREKLLLKGISTLSDAELIAILIGSGTKQLSAVDVAKLILNRADNDLNKLAKLTVKDLIKIKGIGEAKAISIVSALELGRRRKETESEKLLPIISSKNAFDELNAHFFDLPHEEFWVLYLNRANILIKKSQIGIGGLAMAPVDLKIIFKNAIDNLASGIILAHNHPSGSLKPSEADIRLTKSIVEAGKIMTISVLDHLIISDKKYFSFRDEDMM